MACVLNKSEVVISAASALSKLHLDDVVHQLVRNQVDTETTLEDFICTIARWELIWNMNSSFVKLFLQQLSYGMTEAESHHQQTKYLRYFSTVHVLSLLQEMDMYKGKLLPTESRRDGTVHNEQTQTCIMYLKLDRTADVESGTIAFYRTHALENRSRLCQGQFVAITRQCDLEAVCPSHKAVCCVGQIQTLRPAPFTVIIKVEGEVPEIIQACLKSDGFRYWRLDLIGNITTFVRVVAALKHFTCAPKTGSLMSYISHPQGFKQSYTMHTDSNDDGDFPGVGFIHSENEIDVEGLNEKQKEAVYLALGRNICLIQGPPGTGKTKVACNIIKEVVGMKKYKGVLIVAETNVAVDNITQRLRNDMLVVRLGSMEGIASDLYDVSLEGQVKLIADREAKRTKVRDKHGDTHRNTRLINKVLSAADIVLATCAGAGEPALESCTFEFVLVDEATQTMETTLLCSLAHGAKHLVMIGDHKQLGPTISGTPDDDVVEGIPDVSDLAQSLFHRLIVVKEIPSCFLDTQHRMHPELMKFPSTEFYEDKLQAAGSTLNSRVIFPWPCTKPYRPLCFINVDGKEMKRGTSYCNLKEIEVVQKVVDVLLKVHEEMFREFRLGVNHIGILTLYQGQVMELKKRVTDSVTVSSVDGFQGQEKEVIIVSTVRCNDRAIVGFSGDAKRINVLLTRAKKGLIVIGNAKTLEGSELWSRWINQAPTLSVTEIAPVSKESTLVNERKKHIR